MATTRKAIKYVALPTAYVYFQSTPFESHGPMNTSAVGFSGKLSQKIASYSGDETVV